MNSSKAPLPPAARFLCLCAMLSMSPTLSAGQMRLVERPSGFSYTTNPLVSQVTVISLVHLIELRSAINAVRQQAGLGQFLWTDAQPTFVRGVHVAEMRSALGQGLAQLGRPVPTWTDSSLAGAVVKAIHFQELRDAASFGPSNAGGTIASNTTWTPRNSPYIVQSDVTVTNGSTLTLAPGTIVKFKAGTSLSVLGGSTLTASGTTAQPIVFTSIKDDSVGGDTNVDGGATQPLPGDWSYLTIGSQGSQAFGSLQNVIAKYGTQLSVRFSAPAIQNLTSTHMSATGLYIESPPPIAYTIASLTLTFNPTNLSLNSVPRSTLIQDSIIRGATSFGVLATSGTAAAFVNNSIDDNFGVTEAIKSDGSCPLLLRSNSITNNRTPSGHIMGISGCCTQIDARSNWWGSTTGPDIGQPGTGGGSEIRDNVLFDDWLGLPFRDLFKLGQHPWTLKAGVSTDVSTGNFYLAETDFRISTTSFPLEIVRTYNNIKADIVNTEMGAGWTWTYGTYILAVANGVVWYRPDGAGTFFKRNPDDTFSSEEGVYERLVWIAASGTYRMTRKDQSILVFDGDGKLSSEIDANGNTTVVVRDANRHITRVTEPTGRSLNFQYNGSYVSTISDPIGRVISYTRDGNGAVTNVTKRDQSGVVYGSESYTYSGGPWGMVSFSDDSGDVLNQAFDGMRRVSSQQFNGLAPIYFYYGSPSPSSTTVSDTHGRLHQYYFGLGNNKVTLHQHQQANGSYNVEDQWNEYLGYLASVYIGLDGTTGNVFDWATGNLRSVTEPGGRTTFYDYDPFNNVTRRTDNLGRVTTYSYDTHQNLTHETNALGQLTEHQYYPNGQTQFVIDARGNASSFAYDSFGYPAQVTNGANQTTRFEFDAAGRKTTETDALGHRTFWTYNGRDQILSVTDPLGNRTSYTYDNYGRKFSMTDALGRTTFYTYNSHNLPAFTIDARNGQVQMIYSDATGNLTQIVDPNGHSTFFEYDDLDRKITETDALGRSWHFEYAGRNRLSRVVDAAGASTYRYYDQFNQLYQVNYPDNRAAFFGYDGVGNRTGLSDWNGSTGWGYDALNRQVGFTRGASSVNYGYDAAGNLAVLTYPTGGQVHYGYDGANRMTSVSDFSGRTTTYTYDVAGRLSSCTYPNGVAGLRGYDDSGRLTHIGYAKGGTTLRNLDYSYDSVGNRVTVRTNGGTPESYGYDELYRVTSVNYPDGRSVYYSYDAAGNRTYQFDTRNGFGQNFGYDAANEMLNDDFGWRNYDPNGAFIAGARPQNLSWNGQHLLARMQDPFTTMTAEYDGEGRRIRHTSYGVTTDYVVDTATKISRVLAETANGATTYYIYGLDLLYTLESSGPHFVHQDALGSVVLGTDVNGSIEGQFQFDVFGRLRTSISTHWSQRQFAGEETDISELIFLRARYYDPLSGRFLSTDPVAGDAIDTQALNPYTYARNNPVCLTDPSGEYFGWDDAAFALAGGLAGVLGQAVGDRISGQPFRWTNYGAAFVGGAAGGWALEYTGPVLSGMVSGATTNALRQSVNYVQNRMANQPASLSFSSFVAETAVGGISGLIPGARIPGLTTGSNSYNAIFGQMTTKLANRTITRATGTTVLKMVIGRTLDKALFSGSVVGASINAFITPRYAY